MVLHTTTRTVPTPVEATNIPVESTRPSRSQHETAPPQDAVDLSTTSGPSSFISNIFSENPYFNAGFGLMGLGVALTVLRQSAALGSTALRRRMLVSLEIPNRDKSYEWVLAWMAREQAVANAASISSLSPAPSKPRTLFERFGSRLGALGLLRSHELSVETKVLTHKNGSSSVLFDLVAGPGVHWMRYKGVWMQVRRDRETKSTNLVSGTPWETITLTTLSSSRYLFPSLLSDARDLALKENEGKLVIHTAWGIEWRPFGLPRRKRPLGSVVLDDGVTDRIVKDVRGFLERRTWYADRGIPYRRGYLLHGPPGSGKSSFIQALAGSLNYDICLLNLSERGLGDDKLNHLLSNAPERSIILIEDIDAAFNKRVQTTEDGYQSSVTFSGFLNALDGVASGEERIIFMTTNHVSKLDPALIRPGRVDLSVLIDDALPSQAKQLFTRFYDSSGIAGNSEIGDNLGYGTTLASDEIERIGEELAKIVEDEMGRGRRVSMAALQGLFIRTDADKALNQCRELFVLK